MEKGASDVIEVAQGGMIDQGMRKSEDTEGENRFERRAQISGTEPQTITGEYVQPSGFRRRVSESGRAVLNAGCGKR